MGLGVLGVWVVLGLRGWWVVWMVVSVMPYMLMMVVWGWCWWKVVRRVGSRGSPPRMMRWRGRGRWWFCWWVLMRW
ncbi:predicted protein [Streptomyces iranensis]|uniref:Transmembrane protein n=1 Tax=Streptomyces iranensis TaxID=576784 RepID=A0A060ZH11_9ACTN|nr:predicted protein [Streptomyces iranensis]CDR05044.1 predicted protein [Streptomyces iranensis]